MYVGEVDSEVDQDLIIERIEEKEIMRQQYISELKFAEAEKIHNQINGLVNRLQKIYLMEYRNYFEYLVTSCRVFYNEKVKEVVDKFKIQKIQERKIFSGIFHQLQIQHVSAIVDLEKEYMLRFIDQTIKPSKETRDKVFQSDRACKVLFFDKAQFLKDDARSMHIKYRNDVKQRIYREFLNIRRVVFDHQKSELVELSNKLESRLVLLDKQKNEEIEMLKYHLYKELNNKACMVKSDISKDDRLDKSMKKMAMDLISLLRKQSVDIAKEQLLTSSTLPED